MKKVLLYVFLIIFFIPVPAQGGFDLSIDLFTPTRNLFSETEITPEYSWFTKTEYGKFSGFGFIEKTDIKDDWIGRNALHWAPYETASYLAVSGEFGRIRNAGFLQLGGRVDIHKLPFLNTKMQAIFKRFSAGYYSGVFGALFPTETILSWETQSLKFWEIALWSEGIYRIRDKDDRDADFGEPQIWLRAQNFSNVAVGVEWELIQGKITSFVGVKIIFLQ